MKRYAIVRVDKDYYLNCCPAVYEEIKNDFVCSYQKSKTLNSLSTNCKNCRYGDTKEQLINKIETAVAIMRNKMTNKEVYLDRAVATFIVEFLGVEE